MTILEKINGVALCALQNENARGISDRYWNEIGKFTNSHGHLSDRDFKVVSRREILEMLIDEMFSKIDKPEGA